MSASTTTSSEPLVGEVAVHPTTGRPAGRLQATILLLSSCLSVLGAVLLAPVLPRIQQAFAGTPGVEALAPIVLTAPALIIGLTAMIAGRIVDRVGRKRLLVGALIAYAFLGTAPLWLTTLPMIVLSRVLVGLAEAAIMTCCTTMLADYFHGQQRDRYFALQVIYTTVAATGFLAIGGLLGAQNWRAPFWLYAVSLPLAVLTARYIWQPLARPVRAGYKLPALPWRTLAAPVVVTLIGGITFYVMVVELAYKFGAIGVTSTAVIGVTGAVGSLGSATGAFLFSRLAPRGPSVTVPLAFLLSGLGLVAMGFAPTLPLVVVSVIIAGMGNGLMLPALLTWALGALTFEQRGRGTGAWTAMLFLGEFICPLVVLAITGALGGLSLALIALGVLALGTAVAVRLSRPTITVEPALSR